MKKIACAVFLSAVSVFAGKSPFSMVRAVAWDAAGQPKEEAVDLTVCLEDVPVTGNPSDVNSREHYERIIQYWADGLYEMSNGGNYLGNIRVFTGGSFGNGCDVVWKSLNVWPNANVGSYNSSSGSLNVANVWRSDPFYDYRTNDDEKLFQFGMTLTHESMHYLYGLRDEYGTVSLSPSSGISISADPSTDRISIDVFSDGTYASSQLDAFYSGQHVLFFPVDNSITSTDRIPLGLWDAPHGDSWAHDSYMVVDEVVWAQDGSPSISFNLKDPSGNRVDIKDAGNGSWGVSLPDEGGSSAHTVQNTQWPLYRFKYGRCSSSDIPWQWANLSTEFNFNPYSKHGLTYKNSLGKSFSGWETVVSNPVNDVFFKSSRPWGRFWFKSLINRAPTASDVYSTKTHYLNYDETTGSWDAGDATWRVAGVCNTKNVDLPYMKIELAGRSEADYIKDTRKHLNIQWMDGLKAEVVVVLDHSGSMSSYDKMEQAKLASKYVATGFLGGGSGFSSVDVSVGVYTFNQNVTEVYALQNNPSKNAIYNSISSVTASGRTALFDALETALKSFTDDPTSLKMLYVISDGLDNASSKTKQEIIDLYNSKNVAIHTFAYGKDADAELLASMAASTGGTFYDQQENMVLNVNAATSAVLSNTLGIEQVAASVLAPSSQSSEIFVPHNAGRLRIYGSYEGSAQANPMTITSAEGANVSFSEDVYPMGNMNYFIAEIDSLTLLQIPSSKIKISNNLTTQNLDFRALLSEKRSTYAMSLGMTPNTPYNWPEQRAFTASVSGRNGILAGVSVKGKMKYPDGTDRQFDLYDDGTHGDVLAGDGVYFGYMPTVQANGTYQWEVVASNVQKTAHTTRIGTSLPDEVEFVETSDVNPFELIRNGQFVVNNCCTDIQMATIQPENIVQGFLKNGVDQNKFKIIGTKSDKTYSLILQSQNLSMVDKIEIFAPQDLNTPLYSNDVKENSDGKNIFALSPELALPGNIIVVSSARSTGANYSLLLLESNDALFTVGQFEKISDWHTDYSSIALDRNLRSEGMSSLSAVAGWKNIESRNIVTSEFRLIGDKMSIDVYVPSTSQNQYWLGTVELWAYVPSSNKRIQLGTTLSIQPTFNTWMTYDFSVPSEVLDLLSEPHSDFRFQIVLNSADSVWVDNLRFAGHLVENNVGKYVLRCPGQVGCIAMNPIRLPVNGSIEVTATGELWIEVVGFPEDWTPASLNVALFAMDGAKLTGTLGYMDDTYPLTDWGFSKTFEYEREKRYLFRLYNVGGRPYRINAWVSGQAMNLASNNLNNWNVIF